MTDDLDEARPVLWLLAVIMAVVMLANSLYSADSPIQIRCTGDPITACHLVLL